MKKAGIYVRVSTEEQAKHGFSVAAQSSQLVSFADKQVWEYELYVDDGYSATSLKRPEIGRLIRDIVDDKIQVVLVVDIDRLCRNQRDQEDLKEMFRSHDVELWGPSGRFDIETADGDFQVSLLGILAQRETKKTSERITTGMHRRAEEGKFMGGPSPYGYTTRSHYMRMLFGEGLENSEVYALAAENTPEDKTLYVYEKEAELVRLIYRFYVEDNYSLSQVHEYVNARYRSRSGGLFHLSVVSRILSHPVYAGKIRWNRYTGRKDKRKVEDEWVMSKGVHEPIISPDMWQKAQQKRERSRRFRRRRNSSFVLTGCLFCGTCGSRMIGYTNVKGWKGYKCLGQVTFGKNYCKARMINARKLEPEVFVNVQDVVANPELMTNTFNEVQHRLEDESGAIVQQAQMKRDSIASLDKKIARWYDAFEQGSLQPKQFSRRVAELEAQKEILDGEFQTLNQSMGIM